MLDKETALGEGLSGTGPALTGDETTGRGICEVRFLNDEKEGTLMGSIKDNSFDRV